MTSPAERTLSAAEQEVLGNLLERLTSDELKMLGYKECTKCDCKSFTTGGANSVTCGTAGCSHGFYDHKS